ncbi:ATP-binding cassette domain-containing protein [Corynebacterium aquilae]|uniref:ATP-binding cassette domain-containing protein n=1 Tax=Corynebacterium aquilae TaxID=203263 RepID=UPI000950BC4C|nr:ATP-binding cassette domain-containing protein [Corynebacterium aquilae]
MSNFDHRTPIVSLQNLTVRIPLADTRQVVHAATDVSLDIFPGQVLAIVGESGCGKSIIASAMTGGLQLAASVTGTVSASLPQLGTVNLVEENKRLGFYTPPRGVLGHHIALVPQSAATFLTPVRTVGSQLEETVVALGNKTTLDELLEMVELEQSVLGLYPHEMSGGMAQRAAIAFAVAGRPEVIVADEPTASLDPERTRHIFTLLGSLAAAGAAVVLITHDIADVRHTKVADRAAVVYASRIVEHGPAEKVLRTPKHPYTRDLLAALPENGMHPMPGVPPTLTDLAEDYTYDTRLAQHAELMARLAGKDPS